LGDFFERKLRPKTEKCAQTAKCTTYLGKIFGDFFIKTWPKTEKCAQTAKCTTYLGKILGDFFIKNAAKRQKNAPKRRNFAQSGRAANKEEHSGARAFKTKTFR
jgi:hypothetical protein